MQVPVTLPVASQSGVAGCQGEVKLFQKSMTLEVQWVEFLGYIKTAHQGAQQWLQH